MTAGSDLPRRLVELADELRAIAANGLHYCQNPYDQARYERLRGLAATAMSLVDSRDAEQIERLMLADLGTRTPLATADAAVFDASDRLLLIQRSDCAQWCMPGGAADVGETPSQAAQRETFEETGLEVKATELLGLYDNRRISDNPSVQAYGAVFAAEVIGGQLVVTHESLAVGWFTESQTRELTLFRGHKVKIPDVFRWRRGQTHGPIFH